MDNTTPEDDKKIPPQPIIQPVNYQQPQNPQQDQSFATQNASQNLNPETDRVTDVKKPSIWKRHSGFLAIIQLFVGAFILAAVINSFIFQSYQVFGQSMANTLHEGDRLIISKVSKSLSSITGDYVPTRGDIIVFRSPLSPDIQLIKRVIALPGEKVTVSNGKITVFNDENPSGFNPDAEWQSLLPPNGTGNIETVVGENEVFVAGDNRVAGASLDSRNELGNVPVDSIVGELFLRLFPLNQAEFF